MQLHKALCLAPLALLALGCASSVTANPGSGSTGSSATTLAVTPQATSIASSQALTTTIAVSASSSTAAGTVVLASGSYASFPATLQNGAATVMLPAGVLAAGSDTLTATYTPAAGSSAMSATGTASVSVAVSTGTTPQVTTASALYPTAGKPFKAIPLTGGTVLVSIAGSNTGIQVFTPSGTALTPGCVNALSSKLLSQGASSLGMTLFPNTINVALAIGDPGVDFFSTASLTSCNASGTGVYVPQGSLTSGQGSINVVITSDGKYAFVADEYGVASGASSPGNVGVVALQYDASGNVSTSSTVLGQISTGGNAVPGLTLSPDGSRLYVTSEISTSSAPVAGGTANAILTHSGCAQAVGFPPTVNGLLTVIDVAKAEANAGQGAVLTTVNAGCSPGRAVESSDGNLLYVTARGDDRLLIFSTGMLEQNASNALLGYGDTGGTAPVGLQLFHGQQLLAVANSNRFGTGAVANATIVNVANPLAPTVLQTVVTGLFPREFSVAADDGTLFLTNYDSNTLEVITTTVH